MSLTVFYPAIIAIITFAVQVVSRKAMSQPGSNGICCLWAILNVFKYIGKPIVAVFRRYIRLAQCFQLVYQQEVFRQIQVISKPACVVSFLPVDLQ
jgi:hypothetical protein